VIFFLAVFVFSSVQVRASELHATIGAAPNYAGLGALRLGYGEWEVGQLTRVSYGIDRLFKAGESTYTSLGLGLTFNGAAVFASIGFNYAFFLNFGLRGELTVVQDVAGFGEGIGMLGVSWNL